MAPIEDPDHVASKKKVNLQDTSGAEHKDADDTATAILKKKKKPNQLMYVSLAFNCLADLGDLLC